MYKSEACQERNNNEKLKDKDLDAKQLKHFCQSRTKTKEGLTRERKHTLTQPASSSSSSSSAVAANTTKQTDQLIRIGHRETKRKRLIDIVYISV